MLSGSGRREGCISGVRRVIVGGLLALAVIVVAPGGAQEADLLPVAEDARGMELQRYRDAVRRHFVLKQYKELLELTEKYGHLYPEDEGTEFYRTQAEIRIEEAEKKIPFARLEDRDFKIPEAPEGAPSLLEELRKSEAELEAGAAAGSGELGLESAPDDRIAMGAGPLEETLRAPEEGGAVPRRSPTQGDGVADGSDPGAARQLPDDIAPAGGTVEGTADAGEGGAGPLLLILAVCAVILGVVAALLLFGLMRRGRTKEPLLAGSAAVVEAEGPPAPPLFNFEDEVSQPAPLGDTFGASEMPDPFAETATPEGASAEFASASVSSLDEASAPDYSSPAALGETRSGDVNQEISDLLYSPGTGSDSVFDALPGRHTDIPAPLGETRADQPAFSSAGGDTSDLVQLPDEDSFSLDSSGSDADVDALFASASEPSVENASQLSAPDPAASASVDLSSIDIFGDPSQGEVNAPARGSTTRVGLDEIDASMPHGSDSSAEIDSPGATRASAPPDDVIEIPFALEDPFQNLSSKLSDETAFNTSTAEAMAAGSSDAETGADQRELLQIMEEGGTDERPAGPADDLWSGATSGGSMEDSRSQPPAADSAITFQEDETAVIEFSDAGSGDEPTGMAGPNISEPEAETVVRGELTGTGGESQSDAPFDREKLRGQEALQLEDWSKAVYHLSIAATLRPEAQDVREDLRRARKMKKEQQTG